MKSLLEISGEDIASLSDGELRELVGLLCEADCKSKGFSASGVMWGGHQDAKDGGLDVIVNQITRFPEGFIQREKTGFQIKKPKMSVAQILSEMKPEGILRTSIKQLIQEEGSYIIVSSQSSTTDSALKERVKAMRNAVSSEKDYHKIHLDFYDKGRIATWVRLYPSLILWVRNRIGRHLQGWRPYENWIRPGNSQDEYIIDKDVRLFDETSEADDKQLSVETGINKLRNILSHPGECVRLVGLSGVGKTRFVQAIFDTNIGNDVPASSQVLYTDMSDSPEPLPNAIAEQFEMHQ